MKVLFKAAVTMMISRSCAFQTRFKRLASTNTLSAASTNTKSVLSDDTFSVAPMMEYTDRHLRFMLRMISSRAKLYTEMVTANTIIHNDDLNRWLSFNEVYIIETSPLPSSCSNSCLS